MRTVAKDEHVSPLTAMLYPGYTKSCDCCGGYVATSPEEALRRWTETTYEPLAKLAAAFMQPTSSSTLGLPTFTAFGTGPSEREHHHGWHGHHEHGHHHAGHGHHGDCGCHEGCGCHECRSDACHCECCVVNADLVVNARLGERRVVPLTFENSRRREREITLELSDFTSRGGKPSAVTGRLIGPTSFTLAPCAEHETILVVDVAGDGLDGADVVVRATAKDKTNADAAEGRRPLDVDDCEVAYADLRVTGCEIRPLRIAVSTLPRDCHSYPVECGCGCC
jgi:hypothetical protein